MTSLIPITIRTYEQAAFDITARIAREQLAGVRASLSDMRTLEIIERELKRRDDRFTTSLRTRA